MKKVLITHFRNDIVSGAEKAIADMVNASDPNEWDFYMLVPGEGLLLDYYNSQGIKTINKRIETKRRKYPGLHSLQSAFYTTFFKRFNFDLIIANTFAALSRIDLVAKWTNTPLVVYVREYFSFKKSNLRLLKKVNYVFAVSKDVREYLSPVYDLDRVFVTYDYIDHNKFEPKHSKEDPQKLSVGFIGRLTKYKQPHLFINAMHLVLSKLPETSVFIIGGSSSKLDQQYISSLRQLVQDLDLGGAIKFEGHVEKPVEVMSCLDVICITSDREPFPRVVLESLLLEKAVIASDSGGCSEMIQDDVSGLLFESNAENSAEILAEKIIGLLSDSEQRKRLGKKGRTDTLEKFSWAATVSVFQDHMNSIIDDY